MGTRALAVAVLACVAAVASTGCSSSASGNAAPRPVATSASAAVPHHGAPAVDEPLMTTAAETEPCSLATSNQVAQVGGPVESIRVSLLGAGKFCTFVFANGSGTVALGVDTIDKDGLSHLYALKAQNSGVTTFEPQSSTLGYPVVKFANGGERPYVCQLAVGVNNQTMLMIFSRLSTGNPYFSDPCGISAKVSGFAIQSLKSTR
ncbi:DUF3558 domain-containing protein [Amycolatopsis sp. NPDC051372]|uniref:DUF3558 domain-containing protein n=1 Tax=unclassified Amycolatopsis TaxID=2618356 RepID=UPI0034446285